MPDSPGLSPLAQVYATQDASMMGLNPFMVGGSASSAGDMNGYNPFMAAPAMSAAQQMIQQGTDTSPAYLGTAIARAGEGLMGTMMLRQQAQLQMQMAMHDAPILANYPGIKGTALGAALSSGDPAVVYSAWSTVPDVIKSASAPYTLNPGQMRYSGTQPLTASPMPQSPQGKLAFDYQTAVNAGNPIAAGYMGGTMGKNITQPETGLTYPQIGSVLSGGVTGQGAGSVQTVPVAGNGQLGNSPTAGSGQGFQQPGQTPSNVVSPQGIANAKAGIAAATTGVGANIDNQKAAVGAAQQLGGPAAYQTLNTLKEMQSTLKNIQANGGVATGPYAQDVQEFKAILNGAGLLSPDQANKLSDAQIVTKLNAYLASSSVKTMTGRGTQFELKTFQQNNPGLDMTPQASMKMIKLLKQQVYQNLGAAKLAGGWNYAPGQNFMDALNQYYQSHPIVTEDREPTPAAIQALRTGHLPNGQPVTPQQFDQQFGVGASQDYLGQQ